MSSFITLDFMFKKYSDKCKYKNWILENIDNNE